MNRISRGLARVTASRRGVFAAAVVCLSLLGPSTAWAWGREGHRIVALIAAGRLTPTARARVAALLGPDVPRAMETASTWADEIRDRRPRTERWHFVDIEISGKGYDAARDCPRGNCIVAQILKDERLLADRRLPLPARAEALRFLIHFVGDIQQPLHCADHHDRGGNSVRVMLNGEETNLHAVWDTAMVASLGDDPAGVAAALDAQITPREVHVWGRGGPVEWANESFAIAKHDIYGPLQGADRQGEALQLPADYSIRERPLVAEQLEKGGVRLATVLNRVLAAPARNPARRPAPTTRASAGR